MIAVIEQSGDRRVLVVTTSDNVCFIMPALGAAADHAFADECARLRGERLEWIEPLHVPGAGSLTE